MASEIIVAPATLTGGAIALVRLSGEGSIELVSKIFTSRNGVDLKAAAGYTMHYGEIVDGEYVIDDVIVSIFRTPHSYTSEDSVEISCHGSRYIVDRIIDLSIRSGARLAEAGEFTLRAFTSGRLDLSQAEAVADLIATTNEATHRMATMQLRGGYSTKLQELRSELLRLCSLIELELDFSEEDVTFADRTELCHIIDALKSETDKLKRSFKLGNALRHGVSVAIIGSPNAGKSTLLNRILGDDRAMVSSIAGTTRDTIEEVINIDGIDFRFIDTAGLHETDDELEQMGIERSLSAISKSDIILHIVDATSIDAVEPLESIENQKVICVLNKIDLLEESEAISVLDRLNSTNSSRVVFEHNTSEVLNSVEEVFDRYSKVIAISAKSGDGVEELLNLLSCSIDRSMLYSGDVIVSNARHYTHLNDASISLEHAISAIQRNISSDLLAEDLRQTLYHIGSITGSITPDDILINIFSNFCIGK